jgi:hypothetical protein
MKVITVAVDTTIDILKTLREIGTIVMIQKLRDSTVKM